MNITDVRLSNGTGPYDGRAEIKVGDQWGTICNTNFDLFDADAFCRFLGLRQAAESSVFFFLVLIMISRNADLLI